MTFVAAHFLTLTYFMSCLCRAISLSEDLLDSFARNYPQVKFKVCDDDDARTSKECCKILKDMKAKTNSAGLKVENFELMAALDVCRGLAEDAISWLSQKYEVAPFVSNLAILLLSAGSLFLSTLMHAGRTFNAGLFQKMFRRWQRPWRQNQEFTEHGTGFALAPAGS